MDAGDLRFLERVEEVDGVSRHARILQFRNSDNEWEDVPCVVEGSPEAEE